MCEDRSSPSEVLILGAGVFGLSTALALLKRPQYANTKITILDAASQLPNPSAASVDTSRILRADYAIEAYTKLVSEAQELWRDKSDNGWGGQGRYQHARLVLTSQPGTEGHVDGYIEESLKNLKHLAASDKQNFDENDLKELHSADMIRDECRFPGSSGNYGYVNGKCGWVNAEKCVGYALDRLRRAADRVDIRTNSNVRGLVIEGDGDAIRCCGVELEDGSIVRADLIIAAAGAWTPSLVDLGGRAVATCQVLAYLSLEEAEQKKLKDCPIYFNVSRGMFMVPPHHKELKVGRHGFGYQNTKRVAHSVLRSAAGSEQRDLKQALVSIPRTDLPIPPEAEAACKEFLSEMFPQWKDRPFTKTRLCWYCDTANGDFLIDHHPQYPGLFIATGDSGHGFKVFPIIGEKIVDSVERRLEHELQELWRWAPDAPSLFYGTSDGTRGGRRGMLLEEELLRAS